MKRAIDFVNGDVTSRDDDIGGLIDFISDVKSGGIITEPLFRSFMEKWDKSNFPDTIREDFLFLITPLYGSALNLVPENMRTDALCKQAIMNNPKAIELVDERDRTAEMCKAAVYQDPSLYKYCIKNGEYFNLTKEMVIFMVSQNPQLISVINRHWWFVRNIERYETVSVVLLAVSKDPETIKLIDDFYLRNERVCYIAVVHDGLLLKYVPKAVQSPLILETAVQQNPLALEFVLAKKTLELCRMAFVDRYPNNVGLAYPRQYQNSQLFRDLPKLMANNLVNVPWKLRDFEICKHAYKFDHSCIDHIPKKIRKSIAK